MFFRVILSMTFIKLTYTLIIIKNIYTKAGIHLTKRKLIKFEIISIWCDKFYLSFKLVVILGWKLSLLKDF